MKLRVEKWLGHEIRFVEKLPNDWWAVAVDVTKALGIKNTSLAVNGNPRTRNKGLRESEKGICKHYTLGGEQELLVISEPGIYRLIFRSNKPDAEAFQDWVFDTLKLLRQSAGLEGFQIFRMMDKEHQKEAMSKLSTAYQESKPINHIRANTITNKAVSKRFGYKKMLKKHEMTPDMLAERQPILDDTVGLIIMKSKFDLDVSVSEKIYEKYREMSKMA